MRRSAAALTIALSGALTVAAVSQAFGHAHLTSPTRRANCQGGDDATCKGAGPCGGTPNPTVTPFSYTIGAQVQLTWDETINHTSTYQINLSTNGGATQASFFPIMPENAVPDQVGPASYAYNWTVPNITGCNPGPCVMQFIQDMDATVGTISNPYYNCADVRILPAGAPTPSSTPTSEPTPTPSNPNDPVEIDAYGSCSIAPGDLAGGSALAAAVLLLGAAVVRRRRAH